eukprot:323126-Prorocentrum_minimum.AAC.1
MVRPSDADATAIGPLRARLPTVEREGREPRSARTLLICVVLASVEVIVLFAWLNIQVLSVFISRGEVLIRGVPVFDYLLKLLVDASFDR